MNSSGFFKKELADGAGEMIYPAHERTGVVLCCVYACMCMWCVGGCSGEKRKVEQSELNENPGTSID